VTFLAFLGVSLLVIVTPGQDTALTLGNALSGGRRAGISTAAGVATGQATWTLATSAGLAALLVASEPAFLALRLLGSCYLVYLGVQALLRARRGATVHLRRGSLSPAVAYRRGLVSNLGNPKVAVFFTSLLPQFAPHPLSFATLAVLGLVFCTLTFAWLTLYSVVVDRVGASRRVRRVLEAATGAVLVATGVRLATER
jgi:threonine/homoserine/homoserine lactone efflux protein